MSKKLFIGGLSWDTNDNGLKAAFSKFGTVQSADVVKDKETGRSRGFAFVVFDDDAAGDAAVAAMDGASLDGRNIKVNEAQAKGDRGGRGGDRGGRGGDRGGRGGPRERGPSGFGTGYGGMGDGEPVW